MKNPFFTTLTLVALSAATQAGTLTWNFQEKGSNLDLGSSASTFTEGTSTLAVSSSGPNLYAKNLGGDETGLGLVSVLPDTDNEIIGKNWISIANTPTLRLQTVVIGSVQTSLGESASVYWGLAPGSLTKLVGTITADASVDVSAQPPGYITVTAPTGNVLINTVTATVVVRKPCDDDKDKKDCGDKDKKDCGDKSKDCGDKSKDCGNKSKDCGDKSNDCSGSDNSKDCWGSDQSHNWSCSGKH